MPDATTWADAAAALERFGGDAHSDRVRGVIRGGVAGALPDTPKPGHPSLARAMARVIGSRVDAMEGARAAAIERGYHAIVMPEPVTGEARDAAPGWLDASRRLIGPSPRPGLRDFERRNHRARDRQGHGGRNLEFALALADAMPLDAAAPRWRASAPTASTARPASPAASSIRRRWRARVQPGLGAAGPLSCSERFVRVFRAAGRCRPAGAHRHQCRRFTGITD